VDENFSIPQYVEWQITGKCNLNCIHCATAWRQPQKDLSTADATALVHELLDSNIKSITLSGGEPLLRDDWELLVSIFRENGVSVQIMSNGQNLGETEARKMQCLDVNFVWLSLDGTESAHNTIRQHPRAFERVMHAAAQLERMGVPFGFMTTLLAVNHDQIPELSEIVQDTSSALWQIWLGNRTNATPIWLNAHKIREVLQVLPQLRSHTPQLIIGDNIGYGKLLESLRIPAFVDYTPSCRFTGCYGARTIMGITNDGTIKGCLSIPESQSLLSTDRNAPLSARYRQAAIHHRRTIEMTQQKCRGCGRYRECNGGCPAFALTNASVNERRFCFVPAQAPSIRSAAISASLMTFCALSSASCTPAQEQHLMLSQKDVQEPDGK